MSDGENASYATKYRNHLRQFFFVVWPLLNLPSALICAKDSMLEFEDDPLSAPVTKGGDIVDNKGAYDSDGSRSIFLRWARLLIHINIGVMRHGLNDAK